MNYSFTWMYNGAAITPTSFGLTTTILNIPSIQSEDLGDYSCSVSNGIQPDGMDNLTLTIAGNWKI